MVRRRCRLGSSEASRAVLLGFGAGARGSFYTSCSAMGWQHAGELLAATYRGAGWGSAGLRLAFDHSLLPAAAPMPLLCRPVVVLNKVDRPGATEQRCGEVASCECVCVCALGGVCAGLLTSSAHIVGRRLLLPRSVCLDSSLHCCCLFFAIFLPPPLTACLLACLPNLPAAVFDVFAWQRWRPTSPSPLAAPACLPASFLQLYLMCLPTWEPPTTSSTSPCSMPLHERCAQSAPALPALACCLRREVRPVWPPLCLMPASRGATAPAAPALPGMPSSGAFEGGINMHRHQPPAGLHARQAGVAGRHGRRASSPLIPSTPGCCRAGPAARCRRRGRCLTTPAWPPCWRRCWNPWRRRQQSP